MSVSSVKTLKVVSDENVKLYNMTSKDFNQIQSLIKEGEWTEEIDTILSKYPPINVDGTISSVYVDWYDGDVD